MNVVPRLSQDKKKMPSSANENVDLPQLQAILLSSLEWAAINFGFCFGFSHGNDDLI